LLSLQHLDHCYHHLQSAGKCFENRYSSDQSPQVDNQSYKVVIKVVAEANKIKSDGVKIIAKNVTDNVWTNAYEATMQLEGTDTNNASVSYYSAIIPANMMQKPGIEYYVKVEDTTGHIVTSPRVNPQGNPYSVAVLPNKKPVITHTNLTQANRGEDIKITGNVKDDTMKIKKVILYYKNKSESTYDAIRVDSVDSTDYDFFFTIPYKHI